MWFHKAKCHFELGAFYDGQETENQEVLGGKHSWCLVGVCLMIGNP